MRRCTAARVHGFREKVTSRCTTRTSPAAIGCAAFSPRLIAAAYFLLSTRSAAVRFLSARWHTGGLMSPIAPGRKIAVAPGCARSICSRRQPDKIPVHVEGLLAAHHRVAAEMMQQTHQFFPA